MGTVGTIGTDSWLEAFAAALADADLDTGDVRIAVRHQIVDGPSWVVQVDDDGVTVTRGKTDDDDVDAAADVTFTWQADDAAKVAEGEGSPLAPFQAGRLRVGGDLSRLADAAALFARLPKVPGGGRA